MTGQAGENKRFVSGYAFTAFGKLRFVSGYGFSQGGTPLGLFPSGFWRDNFGCCFRDAMPKARCDPPEHIREVYERILAVNGRPGGCWDVLDWNPKAVMLVECKRKGEDDIKPPQIRWLESALEAGFSLDNFAICELTLGS